MIALVAHPGQRALVQMLTEKLPLCAVYSPWRAAFGKLPVPAYGELSDLLAAHTPEACCFLRPYRQLESDISACLERQIRVLSAGPANLPPSPRWHWGGLHTCSPLFQQALVQRRLPAFGEPVYLRRLVGGGTDLLSAWWAACQLLAEARDLIGADTVDVQVAACRERGKHHLSLSVSFANRATAHLSVAPSYFSPSADLTLLGSGGLVFADPTAHGPTLINSSGIQSCPPAFLHPEPAWIQRFAQAPPPAAPLAHTGPALQLLKALRRALRLRQLVRVG